MAEGSQYRIVLCIITISTIYGYEAKEYDSVVGDTDFNARKYKSEWGLFTQPDSLLPNVYDPQQLNRYMFERGNPLKHVDPTGHIYYYVYSALQYVWQRAAAGISESLPRFIALNVVPRIESFLGVEDDDFYKELDLLGNSCRINFCPYVESEEEDNDNKKKSGDLDSNGQESSSRNHYSFTIGTSDQANSANQNPTRTRNPNPVIGTDSDGNKIYGNQGDDLPDTWRKFLNDYLDRQKEKESENDSEE